MQHIKGFNILTQLSLLEPQLQRVRQILNLIDKGYLSAWMVSKQIQNVDHSFILTAGKDARLPNCLINLDDMIYLYLFTHLIFFSSKQLKWRPSVMVQEVQPPSAALTSYMGTWLSASHLALCEYTWEVYSHSYTSWNM